MNPDYRGIQYPPEKRDEMTAPASRLLDEKISDDHGAESEPDHALAPTGLNNPFWK